MVQGTYLESFIKIGSVTAEILLTLSLCGGWVVVVVVKSFSCKTQPFGLRLGWGFDNLSLFFCCNVQLFPDFPNLCIIGEIMSFVLSGVFHYQTF